MMYTIKNKIILVVLTCSIGFSSAQLHGQITDRFNSLLSPLMMFYRAPFFNRFNGFRDILLSSSAYVSPAVCIAGTAGLWFIPTLMSPGMLGAVAIFSCFAQQWQLSMLNKKTDALKAGQDAHRNETKEGFFKAATQATANQQRTEDAMLAYHQSTTTQLNNLGAEQRQTQTAVVKVSTQIGQLSAEQKKTQDIATKTQNDVQDLLGKVDKQTKAQTELYNTVQTNEAHRVKSDEERKRELELLAVQQQTTHKYVVQIGEQGIETASAVQSLKNAVEKNNQEVNKGMDTIVCTVSGVVVAINHLSEQEKAKNALINQLIDQQKRNEDNGQAIQLQLRELTETNAEQFNTIIEYMKPKDKESVVTHNKPKKKKHPGDLQMQTGVPTNIL